MARQHLIASNAGHTIPKAWPQGPKAGVALNDRGMRAALRHDHALVDDGERDADAKRGFTAADRASENAIPPRKR